MPDAHIHNDVLLLIFKKVDYLTLRCLKMVDTRFRDLIEGPTIRSRARDNFSKHARRGTQSTQDVEPVFHPVLTRHVFVMDKSPDRSICDHWLVPVEDLQMVGRTSGKKWQLGMTSILDEYMCVPAARAWTISCDKFKRAGEWQVQKFTVRDALSAVCGVIERYLRHEVHEAMSGYLANTFITNDAAETNTDKYRFKIMTKAGFGDAFLTAELLDWSGEHDDEEEEEELIDLD